ncbi:MAG: hypothetical protein JHC59_04825 [Ilumatobacteraceae bacterium]|nr:hypothetical protein [Ilumatobacteraceae bacterium]
MTVNVGTISPIPTEEEAAAIAAAVTMMWPQPVVALMADTNAVSAWRFSGRWWVTDAVSRRARPGIK